MQMLTKVSRKMNILMSARLNTSKSSSRSWWKTAKRFEVYRQKKLDYRINSPKPIN